MLELEKSLESIYSKYSNWIAESREWKELAQGHIVTETKIEPWLLIQAGTTGLPFVTCPFTTSQL